MRGIGHLPSCQCLECKPELGDALPATGARFRIFIELSAELGARDHYTAKQKWLKRSRASRVASCPSS